MPAPEPGLNAGFEILRSQADGAGWALAARVPAESRLFLGHFPGRPIVPGVALLALVARAAADWRGEDGEILGLRGLKLRRPVGPGETLALRLAARPDAGAEIAFELRRGEGDGEAVATGHARVGRRAPAG
jgi:3-hydroxymyristoyl/3-hydroxydecanoyl-(acyl carrier protein) dehydratase